MPYVMWANYDLPEGELPLTSPNYLRSFLLENAGLTESAYDQMVSAVRKDYPSLNAFGFTDSDGKLHSVSELDSVPELLTVYRSFWIIRKPRITICLNTAMSTWICLSRERRIDRGHHRPAARKRSIPAAA